MPSETKRPRPTPKVNDGSKKRQKIEAKKNKAVAPKGTYDDSKFDDVKRGPVTVDSLPWNEVEMPEIFDDAEGFFGLEEIEGVDILREGNTVKFVSSLKSLVQEAVLTGYIGLFPCDASRGTR